MCVVWFAWYIYIYTCVVWCVVWCAWRCMVRMCVCGVLCMVCYLRYFGWLRVHARGSRCVAFVDTDIAASSRHTIDLCAHVAEEDVTQPKVANDPLSTSEEHGVLNSPKARRTQNWTVTTFAHFSSTIIGLRRARAEGSGCCGFGRGGGRAIETEKRRNRKTTNRMKDTQKIR